MGLSGQSVNSNFSTSLPTPLPSDLSKPISTSVFNSTSLVQTTATPSMSTLSTEALQTLASESTAPGIGLPSLPASSVSSPSLPSSTAPPPSDTTKADLPSSSHSTPGSTAPGATQASVQHTTGEPSSTVVSVTVVRATASGPETSTITTHPASTLSTPIVLTTTDSNGSKLTVTPPLVTIWSTSTESDGSFVTATSVVANPQHDQVASESGILRNPGAVAGIFSVVGVAFASLMVCVVFWIRRQRRVSQRNKWIVGMRPQRPNSFADDPFHDDNTPPAMRSLDNTEDAQWDRKNALAPERGSDYGYYNFGQVNPDMYPIIHNGTFNSPEGHQSQPMDITSYTEPNRAHFRHSWTPSTPSVYPVSLSPEEDGHIIEHIVPSLNRSNTSSLPPRPPRSHLRDRAKSFGERMLPTPTESEASNHPSPISESRSCGGDAHVLNKKPILDVRSRQIAP